MAPGYGTVELEAVNLGRERLMTRVLTPPHTHQLQTCTKEQPNTHGGGTSSPLTVMGRITKKGAWE